MQTRDRRAPWAHDGIDTERAASLAAAGVLAGLALTRFRRSPTGLALGALSAGLAAYATRGHGPFLARTRDDTRLALGGPRGVHVREAVTIQQSPSAVYSYWRDLSNLSRFMAHVDRVEVLSDTRSRWHVSGPFGPVQWDAEIINDVPGELIGWRSQRGATVASAGSVRFEETKDGRGTEVSVTLQYAPPAGRLGARLSSWLRHDPAKLVRDDLCRLKAALEAGRKPAPASVSPPATSFEQAGSARAI